MANKRSIIKDSTKIRTALQLRFKELNVTAKSVVEDAKSKNMIFTNASLSKYLNHGNIHSSLSEENIIWLCLRYGIPINLYIGKPTMKNNKVEFLIPLYNEQECITNLNKIFNESKISISNK
jgi:hypothetical protein